MCWSMTEGVSMYVNKLLIKCSSRIFATVVTSSYEFKRQYLLLVLSNELHLLCFLFYSGSVLVVLCGGPGISEYRD